MRLIFELVARAEKKDTPTKWVKELLGEAVENGDDDDEKDDEDEDEPEEGSQEEKDEEEQKDIDELMLQFKPR